MLRRCDGHDFRLTSMPEYAIIHTIMQCFVGDIQESAMKPSQLLTVSEVAALLRLRDDSVRRKIKWHEIPALKVGKRWLVRAEVLEQMLKDGELTAVE